MSYTVSRMSIEDLIILEPKRFVDSRGSFMESFNAQNFAKATSLNVKFVQDNHSHSAKGVLRGLHYQLKHAQGKLVNVVRGTVFDVAVDIRKSSPTFGQWVGCVLSEENNRQMWIPPGFAHGFVVLSDTADFMYKTTEYYDPVNERCIVWNDPSIGITWPEGLSPQLSAKDLLGKNLNEADLFD